MRTFLPYIATAVLLLVLSGLEILFLRRLHPDWWSRRGVRILSWSYPVFGLLVLLLWGWAMRLHEPAWIRIGATLSGAVLVLGVALMFSLPVSGLLHRLSRSSSSRTKLRAKDDSSVDDARRRAFLRTASVGIPLLAVGTGGAGFLESQAPVHTPTISLPYPELPSALDGLRVLQISDLHVGYSISREDLDALVVQARALSPDLVLLTGDLCDITEWYADCLHRLARIPAPLGIFGSIGNHEYFRGIDEILRAYEEGPIPLLRDSGRTLLHRGQPLYLAGADDPKTLRHQSQDFFRATVDAGLRNREGNPFTIMMSHRPQCFPLAATRGVDLTLSGHTHGGQIGWGGRSAFELIWPDGYLWGRYREGRSWLYTTAGAGQWFPYRLGCAREMPLLVLRRVLARGGSPPNQDARVRCTRCGKA